MLEPAESLDLGKFRPWVQILAEAAQSLGGVLLLEPRYAHVGLYRSRIGSTRQIFGNALGLNTDSATALAGDKDYTARRLAAAGLPVPEGLLVASATYAADMGLRNTRVAEGLAGFDLGVEWAAGRYPVVVKPNSGYGGDGVSRANREAELRHDLEHLGTRYDRIRVERHAPGLDHRVVVFDGAVRMAYARHPLAVIGDGVSSIEDLLARRLDQLRRESRGPKVSKNDPRIDRALGERSWQDIPTRGETVALLASANLSTGGWVEDTTDLPNAVVESAIRATSELGLRLAGVDIRIAGTGHTILEVNASPGFDHYAQIGPMYRGRVLDLAREFLCD